ncbi:MAG: hypothetical protein AB7K24_13600 [Gemmataceae bacterium]
MRLRLSRLLMFGLLVLLVNVTAFARAQCSNGRCSVPRDRPAVYRWLPHAEDAGYLGLFRNGVQIGGFNTRTRVYRSYDALNDAWGPPERPPWQKDCNCSPLCTCGDQCRCAEAGPCNEGCPCAGARIEQIPNYGVDLSKLNGNRELITLDGQPVSKQQAYEILERGQLIDDSGKLRLTVIGSDAERRQVLDDLGRAPLSQWHEDLLVQDYPASHWAVAKSGFVTAGTPTIYLQAPDGKVLHRQDDYADGAEGLATALRRAHPDYDPQKDFDLRKLRGLFKLPQLPLPACLLAGGFVFLLVRRSMLRASA